MHPRRIKQPIVQAINEEKKKLLKGLEEGELELSRTTNETEKLEFKNINQTVAWHQGALRS